MKMHTEFLAIAYLIVHGYEASLSLMTRNTMLMLVRKCALCLRNDTSAFIHQLPVDVLPTSRSPAEIRSPETMFSFEPKNLT